MTRVSGFGFRLQGLRDCEVMLDLKGQVSKCAESSRQASYESQTPIDRTRAKGFSLYASSFHTRAKLLHRARAHTHTHTHQGGRSGRLRAGKRIRQSTKSDNTKDPESAPLIERQHLTVSVSGV